MEKSITGSICLLLFLYFQVYADDIDAMDVIDVRKTWRVGISEVHAYGSKKDAVNINIMESIAAVWQRTILTIENHRINFDEKKAMQTYWYEQKKQELYKAIDESETKLFNAQLANDEDLRSKKDAVAAAFKQVEQLELIDAQFVSIVNEKPIEFSVDTENNFISITESTALNPLQLREYAKEQELDIFIYTTIKPLSQETDYWQIEVQLYHWYFNKVIHRFKFSGSFRNIIFNIEQYSQIIAREIIGREWGELEVMSNLESAIIYINDIYVGTGSFKKMFLESNIYYVRVEHPDYISRTVPVVIEEGDVKRIIVDLELRQKRNVLLKSNPSNADVYVNGLWIGKTPFLLTAPQKNSIFTLSYDTYADMHFTMNDYLSLIEDDKNSEIPLELHKSLALQLFEPNDEFIDARNRFYTSLGFLALSGIFPLMFDGIFKSLQNSQLDNSSANKAVQLEEQAFAMLRDGSYFFNIFFFINTVFDLIDYIQSGIALFQYES